LEVGLKDAGDCDGSRLLRQRPQICAHVTGCQARDALKVKVTGEADAARLCAQYLAAGSLVRDAKHNLAVEATRAP
jgi:hypothetical protein